MAGCAGVEARSPTARARAAYDRIFEAMLRISPETATGLGLDTGERAALRSQLSMSGPRGKAGGYQALLDGLPELRRIDRNALAGRERAWLDTVLWLGDRVSEAASIPYGGFGGYGYPIPYVISQLTGSYQSVPDFLDSQHKIETRADCDAYVARLQAFARNVNLEVEQARADAAQGVVPPAYILDKTLTQTRNLRGERGARGGAGPLAGPPRGRAQHRRRLGAAGDGGRRRLARRRARPADRAPDRAATAAPAPTPPRAGCRTASASTRNACATTPAPA